MRCSLASLLLVAVAVAAFPAALALPNYSSNSDNAYPVRPSGADAKHQDRPAPSYAAPAQTTPCPDEQPTYTPTTTPCSTSDTLPTGHPEGALSQGQERPEQQQRPVCPAPVTITRTAPPRTDTVTATRTVHDVRTATRTEFHTVTATVTRVKPVVSVSVKERVVEVTKTSTTTCHVTTTVQEYVTRVKTIHDVRTVTHTVTHEAAALPTHQAKAPSSDYGAVKPYSPPAPAYGPVQPHTGNVDAASDNKAPVYMPTGSPDSAYGL